MEIEGTGSLMVKIAFARQAGIQFRFIPISRGVQPSQDYMLELRIVELQVKRIEMVDHLPHEVAHLVIIQPGDLRPWNAVLRDQNCGRSVKITECSYALSGDSCCMMKFRMFRLLRLFRMMVTLYLAQAARIGERR